MIYHSCSFIFFIFPLPFSHFFLLYIYPSRTLLLFPCPYLFLLFSLSYSKQQPSSPTSQSLAPTAAAAMPVDVVSCPFQAAGCTMRFSDMEGLSAHMVHCANANRAPCIRCNAPLDALTRASHDCVSFLRTLLDDKEAKIQKLFELMNSRMEESEKRMEERLVAFSTSAEDKFRQSSTALTSTLQRVQEELSNLRARRDALGNRLASGKWKKLSAMHDYEGGCWGGGGGGGGGRYIFSVFMG